MFDAEFNQGQGQQNQYIEYIRTDTFVRHKNVELVVCECGMYKKKYNKDM